MYKLVCPYCKSSASGVTEIAAPSFAFYRCKDGIPEEKPTEPFASPHPQVVKAWCSNEKCGRRWTVKGKTSVAEIRKDLLHE